ncbi:MAG: hypothetical protein KDJ88_06500 [Bauldia sp.]|nr:hypothetical protein [Bauldia sp.]
MRLVSASITLAAAVGILAGAGVAASACEWHKTHVTASATPVEQEATLPASSVDPVVIAELGDEAIVPRKPEEAPDSGAN